MTHIIGLLFLAAGIFELVVLRKRNKIRLREIYKTNEKAYTQFYAAYYDKKRKEFPWLDNWIKANGDPVIKWAAVNAGKAKAASISPTIISFIILAVGGMISSNATSSVVGFIIGGLITLAVSFFAGIKILNKAVNVDTSSLDPVSDFVFYIPLECPSCHCPHSWGKTQEETIVERKETTKKTTTTTREYSDGDVRVSKFVWITDTYYGKSITDLKCLNCGHTEHKELNDTVLAENGYDEKDKNSRPSPPQSGTTKYNPPLTAWKLWEEKEHPTLSEGYQEHKKQEQEVFANKTSEERTADVAVLLDSGNAEELVNKAKAAEKVKDYATANALFQKAAEMGNDDAQFYLALNYKYGEGFEKDYAKAVMWLEKAVKSGCPNDLAGETLGDLYREGGYGITQDIEKARYWYQLAADEGSDEAKQALKELKKLK